MVRDASLADLPALLALEAQFPGDRLSRRGLRHHVGNPRARLRVLEVDGVVAGYALVLTRAGSRRARLYSIAVDATRRGQGLGRVLLHDAEAQARHAGGQRLALEVRQDNAAARALYLGAGYAIERRLPGYYEDGGDGLRLTKALAGP